MVRPALAIVAALTLPSLALAQNGSPVPIPPADDDECPGNLNGSEGGGDGGGAPPPVPPDDRPDGDAIAEPGFGFIQVLSPPFGVSGVPRNVEIRLGGTVSDLDLEPAGFFVELRDSNGNRVEHVRQGARMTSVEPLAANTSYLVHIEATDANPCPECFGIQETPFSTGDEIDTTPPLLEGTPPVHVFILPSAETIARCGGFFSGQTHQIVVDWGPDLPVNTWIDVVARHEATSPAFLRESFNQGFAFSDFMSLGNNLPVALGDVFYVAFTPRDLAGNTGPARIVRIRGRSFIDQNKPREELTELWCDMPVQPQVIVPSVLPQNGRIQVDFPLEEIPVALRSTSGDIEVPLIPVEDTPLGHVYETLAPLPAGATFDVVPLACPQCVCAGCAVLDPVSITVGDVIDESAPGAPELVRFEEVANPSVSVGTCAPDRPALLAVLRPGSDDVSAPLDMRYDATIRIEDGVQLQLGRGLVPTEDADGNIVVRIETPNLGRLLGDNFVLSLEVKDAAGNASRADLAHDVAEAQAAGCASSRPAAPAAVLLGLLALVRRRASLRRA